MIFTLALKKAALRGTIYLFQISDQQGYPQVPPLSLPSLFLPCPVPSFPSPRTFYSSRLLSHPSLISLLHSHPLSPPFDLFSPVTPFQFSLPSFHSAPFVLSYSSPLSRPLSLRGSSLHHLLLSSFIHLHCYSCVFHDEALESLRVPIITKSLRPDLNTQCV